MKFDKQVRSKDSDHVGTTHKSSHTCLGKELWCMRHACV